MPHGSFCWTELCTGDVAAAKAFYGDLVGWTFVEQNITGTPYHEIRTRSADGAEQAIGGILRPPPQAGDAPPHWMPYIQVDSVDRCAARAAELGGRVCVPPAEIPGVGRFCVIADPTGAAISLFQFGG